MKVITGGTLTLSYGTLVCRGTPVENHCSNQSSKQVCHSCFAFAINSPGFPCHFNIHSVDHLNTLHSLELIAALKSGTSKELVILSNFRILLKNKHSFWTKSIREMTFLLLTHTCDFGFLYSYQYSTLAPNFTSSVFFILTPDLSIKKILSGSYHPLPTATLLALVDAPKRFVAHRSCMLQL